MGRRHINEFMKSGLANSGRAAGMGILYDDYSEDSGGPVYGKGSVMIVYPGRSEEEKEALNGEVKTYRLTRYERIRYLTVEQIAEKIIELNITDDYCKSGCDNEDCPHELECCIKWLNEEM